MISALIKLSGICKEIILEDCTGSCSLSDKLFEHIACNKNVVSSLVLKNCGLSKVNFDTLSYDCRNLVKLDISYN